MSDRLTDEELRELIAESAGDLLPEKAIAAMARELLDARARITELEAERDKGYRDRAEVIALLATIFPSKMADPGDATGWPVLYLDTPEGQLAWHINPADLELLNTEAYALALDEDPDSAPVWDGHTNAQKSARLHRLATCYQPADFLAAGWRPPTESVGYITGYRNADRDWHIPFDGTPFATRAEATADAQDACVELPGVDWRALTVYDESGEPYRAGER